MLTILFAILIIALVVYVCFWIIDSVGVPHPINMVLKAIVAILGVISILTKAGLLAGTGLM